MKRRIWRAAAGWILLLAASAPTQGSDGSPPAGPPDAPTARPPDAPTARPPAAPRRAETKAAGESTGDLGRLPWATLEQPPAGAGPPPVSPREMLDALDIGESQLGSLFDGQALGDADQETLAKLMFRMPRIGAEYLQRWRQGLSLEELAEQPDRHRASVMALRGTVTQIARQPLLPEAAVLYEFDHYYVLTVVPEQDAYEVLVCTREIPAAWEKSGQGVRHRARFDAIFLKIGALQPSTQLVFASPRAEWLPRRPDAQLGVTPSHVLLAELGMDVGRLEDLPSRNGRPLGTADREAFYQMLHAASQLDEKRLQGAKPAAADVAAMLTEPELMHGQLLTVRGQTARVTRIVVEDADIRQRLGIDDYYQIDFMLPLGDRTVRLGDTEDSPQIHSGFPATLCVRSLPPALSDLERRMVAGQSPSELLDQQLVAEAFFFKLWSYRSQFVESHSSGKMQPAPMLIGARVRLAAPPRRGYGLLGAAAGVGFLVLLAAVVLLVWRTSAADTRYQRQQLRKRFELPEGKSLEKLVDQAPAPDEPRGAENGEGQAD